MSFHATRAGDFPRTHTHDSATRFNKWLGNPQKKNAVLAGWAARWPLLYLHLHAVFAFDRVCVRECSTHMS